MHFSLHRVILILDETWHTAFHIELLGDALFFLSIHLSSLSEDEEDEDCLVRDCCDRSALC